MIKFVGDINYTDAFLDTGIGIGSKIIHQKLDPFQYLNRSDEDIWIGNFECVCADHSSKKGVYNKQFRISPQYLKHIHHLDYYNVANNHSMQHGEEAFNEMLINIESFGASYFGSKKRHSVIIKYKGKKISITGFSLRDEKYSFQPQYWYWPEYKEIEQELVDVSKESDFKIVYVHWGTEFINYPYVDQKKFAHWLIDSGVDLIIGLHPHILQGYEIYNGKYIFYSLGNFVFNMHNKPDQYSTIVNVDFENEKLKIFYEYVYINDKDYSPQIIPETKVPKDCRFSYLNEQLKKEADNETYYSHLSTYSRQERIANYKYMIYNILNYRFVDIYSILCDYVKRKIKK